MNPETYTGDPHYPSDMIPTETLGAQNERDIKSITWRKNVGQLKFYTLETHWLNYSAVRIC